MNKNKYLEFCPNCGSEMIEDAWDYIDFFPNGDMQIQIVDPAWVCRKFCGYYVKIKEDFYQS
ncbi:hypothetical protein [Lysinibacillus sp. BW-2-10]|uniref:hypothetical protein n=1 Tax=Lysinibacillus sp. BW-2-10 TaxID=2590030 RepID=UPI001181049F|nr:hypothetical protein [Lysinibacillus sp. BW-2-10]TSI08306.1 hypothetical protein FJQ64_07345 [Lysinibacillus sp. BW-2-10]